MEGDKDNDDVQMVLPPKEKKLKQTRLPFQMMPSSGSPNTSTKKRKLSSPSPNNSKSSKLQKTGKKENSTIKNSEIIEIDMSEDKEDKKDEPEVVDSPDTLARSKDSKKPDGKGAMKPGALTRFLQKAAGASPKSPASPSPSLVINSEPSSPVIQSTNSKIEGTFPIVLLNRCDNTETNDSSDIAEKSNDSSVLAEPLPDSDKDEDQNSLDKTQDSSSESELEILSSDDDNQEEKKINDETEDTEKTSNDVNAEKSSIVDKQIEAVTGKKRKLTAKEIARRLESAKKRELQQEAKAERDRQRLLDKIKRRKEREERLQELKQKKEADIEAKKKEKEQKDMKKQLEIEQKQKEREQKEKAREEEKRKKEEEKLELERKKQKAASTFASFFVPKKLDNKTIDDDKVVKKLTCNFMPFEVKADMKVAPTHRRDFNDNDKSNFDSTCLKNSSQLPTQLWLDEIRKNKTNIRKTGKTWPAEAKDDIIVLEEEEEDDGNDSIVDQPAAVTEKQRAKLLSFQENRRPPYWGTWRKKSDKITPRKPFNKDSKWFDYEVDSDEEWEEEEPGESLHGSDDEKEEENADDNEYDVDNEFMVPHGYLSDEEARPDEEDEEDMNPEVQEFKLKILNEQFEAEMSKKKPQILKPRVVGIVWQNSVNGYPENASDKVVKFLSARQAWVRDVPIVISKIEQDGTNNPDNSNEKSRGCKKTKVPEEAVSHLIKLIHGNTYKKDFLIREFRTYWSKKSPDEDPLSQISVRDKIKELAKRIPCPDEGVMHQKYCWYVSEEIRKQYNCDDLKLPNQWSYILTPKTEKFDKDNKKDKIEKESKDKDRKTGASLITQFTQKITPDELKKQLIVKPATSSSSSSPSVLNSASPLNRPPKRATLISVPRGAALPSEISKINTTQTDNN